MKALFKNKRGFAFPTVLGTFVLVTSIAAGLFIMVMNMTMMVSSNHDSSEDFREARDLLDLFLDTVNEKKSFDIEHQFFTELLSTEEDNEGNIGVFAKLRVEQDPLNDRIYIVTHRDYANISGLIKLGGSSGGSSGDGGVEDVTEFDEAKQELIDSGAETYSNLVITGEDHTFGDTVITGGFTHEATGAGNDLNLSVDDDALLLIEGDVLISAGSNGSLTTVTIHGDMWIKGNLHLRAHGNANIVINGDIYITGTLTKTLEGANSTIEINGQIHENHVFDVISTGDGITIVR